MYGDVGKGRTTTFMSMFDMLHHAHHRPLETIIARQNKMAGDYDVSQLPDSSSWKYAVTRERMAFISAFYQYAREHPITGPAPQPLWSEWLNKQRPSKSHAIKLLSLWSRAAKRIQRLFRRRKQRIADEAAAKAADTVPV